MKALQLRELGKPEIVSDAPDPVAGEGQVLIEVDACGLNFAELLMVKGEYQETPELPFVPGMEMTGRVIGHGPGVSGPAIGARVAVFSGHGGLAERAAVPVSAITPLPETMSAEIGAGFQVAYGTSHVGLAHRAKLREGDSLLVLGAAGGVGLTAVELGRAMGANVIAAARGPEKLAVAKAAGAHHLIDTEAGNLRDQVRALGGADVVYDPVGGDLFKAALRATNPEGRMLIIGFAAGQVQPIPANILLVKNITVMGFYWGGYLKFAPEVLTQSLGQLFAWHAEGKLKPHISNVLPLDRALEGFELLRSRRSTGKVVISLRDQSAA